MFESKENSKTEGEIIFTTVIYTILSVPGKWVKLEKKVISTGKLKNSISYL